MGKQPAENKQGKGAAKASAKPAKGTAQTSAPASPAVPWAAEQMQQTYGNSAVLKYLQSDKPSGQMSFARPAIGAARYGLENDGPNMSKAGGKPLSVEQAEAFAATARPPTPAEMLNAEREAKKADDLVAWNRIRKDKTVQAAIKEAAKLSGIDADTLEKMIIVESSGEKDSHNNSYHGLMQMGYEAFDDVRTKGAMKKLFDTLTVKDADSGEARAIDWEDVKNDPRANVLVGAIYAKGNLNQIRTHNNEVNKKRSERPVQACLPDAPASYADSAADPKQDGFLMEESAQNLYFAHQQGFGGMRSLYNKPDAAIGDKQRKNMRPLDKEHFTKEGPGKQITNAEYLEAWNERMRRIDQFMKEGKKDDG